MIDRKKELKEYLQKKKNLKEAQLKKKRPPFIVGIPHHGTSPILKDLTNAKKIDKIRNPIPKKEVRSQRVTRASTRMDMGHNMKKIDSVLSISKGSKNVKIAKTVNHVQKFPLIENKATVSCNYFTFTWWLASNNQIMTCPCFLCMIPPTTLWFDLKCFLQIVFNYLEFFKL